MKKQNKTVPKKDGNTFKIFGIELISTSTSSVLGLVEQRIAKSQKTFIVTPNTEFLVFSRKAPWFKRILIQSDIAIPDGVALIWAKEVLKKNNPFSRLLVGFWTGLKVIFEGWGEKRVSGTDLTEKLCQMAAQNNWSVYLFGGEKPGIAKKTLEILEQKYPNLHGWATAGPNLELRMENGEWKTEKKEIDEEWVTKINQKNPDLLFVAFGMGKQEKFIFDNWSRLKVKLAMGVGGAFDYLSGEIKRAPQWLQNSGLEWSYRLIQEPWRWKRQLRLLKFIWLVLKQS